MKKTMKTQDIFLNKFRTNKKKVNVFLANKTKLHGVIVGFDAFTIVLESNQSQTLIYKNHITSITPQLPERPIRSEE